jgi:hypothetical protein
LGARISGEQASRKANEREHVPFAHLIESTPRLAQQLSASQLLHPRGVIDRLDRGVETLAQVRQLRGERQWAAADPSESPAVRGEVTLLTLVHNPSPDVRIVIP